MQELIHIQTLFIEGLLFPKKPLPGVWYPISWWLQKAEIITPILEIKWWRVMKVKWLFLCHTPKKRCLQNLGTARYKSQLSLLNILRAPLRWCFLWTQWPLAGPGYKHISAGTNPTNYKIPSANSAFALGKEPTLRFLPDRCHMEADRRALVVSVSEPRGKYNGVWGENESADILLSAQALTYFPTPLWSE